jgi:hypothetical protein
VELTATQIIIIGLVASVLAQGIKMLSAWLKKPVGEKVPMEIVFVSSLVLAYAFVQPPIPVGGWDIPEIINYLVTQISAVLGLSVAIYIMLLKMVFEKFKLTQERFTGVG